MRGLQRGRVINSVAGHRNDLSVCLKRPDKPQLLLRNHSREYIHRTDSLTQPIVLHLIELRAGYHLIIRNESNLTRDAACRSRIVAGDHHDPYARLITLFYRFADSGTHRVGQSNQTEKFKLEIMLLWRKIALFE